MEEDRSSLRRIMWLLKDLSVLTFFFFFFFFLSSLQLALQKASPTPRYADCAPQRCGNVLVQYPFWLSGRQQPFCGDSVTSFQLTCDGNKTGKLFSTFFGFEFYIQQIYYSNQSVHLTVDGDEICRLFLTTNTTDAYPFILSPSNKRILVLLNCSDPDHRYQNMPCPQLTRPALFVGEYFPNSAHENCNVLLAPVMSYFNISASSNYTAMLMTGWLMTWNASRSCQRCNESGGRCGHDSSLDSPGFICMCPDGVRTTSCKRGKNSARILVAVVAGSAGFVALACAAIFLLWRLLKNRRSFRPSKLFFRNASSSNDPNVQDHFQTHVFSYDELKDATDRFDASRELGDGGYGTVYKGKLRDGRTVAVKCLHGKNCRRVEQFMNEVKILSLLHHQNLVSLYGSTTHHSPELLLVYEFIPNGTVADHLHGRRAAERILTWPMRLRIAIETADALAYLHAVDPPIVHRDVKTTNILLDDSFHVKVADFGLSRLFPMDASHVSTAPQGTPGYVDPEYHRCYQLSGKSDVYSFGVVLIELISSKPPIDFQRERSNINLANMAIAKIQNHELVDLVDKELWHPDDEATRMRITMVAELAFRCLQADGDLRPSIKEVLYELIAIENATSDSGKKEDDAAALVQDDASLIQNVAACSPDTVAGKWVSQSTASNSSH